MFSNNNNDEDELFSYMGRLMSKYEAEIEEKPRVNNTTERNISRFKTGNINIAPRDNIAEYDDPISMIAYNADNEFNNDFVIARCHKCAEHKKTIDDIGSGKIELVKEPGPKLELKPELKPKSNNDLIQQAETQTKINEVVFTSYDKLSKFAGINAQIMLTAVNLNTMIDTGFAGILKRIEEIETRVKNIENKFNNNTYNQINKLNSHININEPEWHL